MKFNNPTYQESSEKEWLITNGLGGYASSSLAGANTRRYHGLLVAAMNPPTGRTVIVSKIEETLIEGGDHFELSSNRYPGTIHPQGFQYLQEFNRLPIPEFHYAIGGQNLVKRIFMPQGSNTTVIEYENHGNTPFRLQLRTLFVHRDYHSLISENAFFEYGMKWKNAQAAVISAFHDAPPLHFAFTKGEFHTQRSWYKNFEYQKEEYRGLDYREDCFCPGYVDLELAPGQSVFLTFSLEEEMISTDPAKLKRIETQRIENLRNHPSSTNAKVSRNGKQKSKSIHDEFFNDLCLSGEQFIVNRKSSGGHTLIAGYHWFTDWGRDTMIAMRGLIISTGKKTLAESIINTFLQYLDGGMLPNRFPDQGEEPEYNTIDATLWLFVVLYEYAEQFQDWKFIQQIFPKLTEILEAHMHGTRFNIHVTEEGLLFGGEGLSQLTWMDAKVGDHVITPRQGCPVEVNALWYNALMIHNAFSKQFKTPLRYEKSAIQVKEQFRKYFFNGAYLNDVIIPGEYVDDAFRPNQLYALSLPFALIDKAQAKKILAQIAEKLLTPLGLRSLDPSHPDFIGTYGGDQWHRDSAYHQGTVWTFLIGEYWLAYLRLHNFTDKTIATVMEMLEPLKTHFYEEDCILGISEIFDGANEYSEKSYPQPLKGSIRNSGNPGAGRGCTHQAWSVGMIIKVLADIRRAQMHKSMEEKTPSN